MVFKAIYLLPLISTFIGWFTNFLAIKMLFHPKKAINLGLFSLQGIFPKRKKALAEKLSSIVSENLLSNEEIKEKILNSGLDDELILEEIENHLDKFLKSKINEKFPMLSMFINDDMINTIKKMLLEEIQAVIPSLKTKLIDKAFKNFDTKGMVENKVLNFSLDELENLLFALLKKEFRFIEIVGAVVGFLIGCVQILLLELA